MDAAEARAVSREATGRDAASSVEAHGDDVADRRFVERVRGDRDVAPTFKILGWRWNVLALVAAAGHNPEHHLHQPTEPSNQKSSRCRPLTRPAGRSPRTAPMAPTRCRSFNKHSACRQHPPIANIHGIVQRRHRPAPFQGSLPVGCPVVAIN